MINKRNIVRVLRWAGILVFLWSLNKLPKRLVTYGSLQTVETLNPKVGVHTRLTDEVEEWKIQRSLQMVREMGSPWIVEYFPWGYYEPSKGHYDWGHPDTVINHAVAQGLSVIARIDYVPQWARPEETTARYLDPEHYADYGDFVAAFVSRYGDRVGHIIVWNEPNLSFEWGYRPVDPDSYVDLLRIAYQRAKETNPSVQVLAAGLAPTLAPDGSEWGLNDLVYLQRMYAAGAGDCMDGMAIHAYGMTFAPDDEADANEINFRRSELTHEVMVSNGDADKPCFVTEGGWNDHPRWTKAVRPYQRLEYTLRAYQMAQDEWDWCDAVCLWAFRFPWPQKSYQDAFTFVTTDFLPKPVYVDVAHYTHGEPLEYVEDLP